MPFQNRVTAAAITQDFAAGDRDRRLSVVAARRQSSRWVRSIRS